MNKNIFYGDLIPVSVDPTIIDANGVQQINVNFNMRAYPQKVLIKIRSKDNMNHLIPDEFESLRDDNWVRNNVEKIVLECTEDNHYKFYHLSQKKNDYPENMPYLKGKRFVAAWGRIGTEKTVTNGRKKEYDNEGPTIYSQMIIKIRKGYKIKTFQCFGEKSESYIKFMEMMSENSDLFD